VHSVGVDIMTFQSKVVSKMRDTVIENATETEQDLLSTQFSCSSSSQIAIVRERESEIRNIPNERERISEELSAQFPTNENGWISEESSDLLEQNGLATNMNMISGTQKQSIDELCKVLGDNLSEASFPSQLIGFDRNDDHYNRTSGKYPMFSYDIENQRKNEVHFLSMCADIPGKIQECMICGKDEFVYCKCRSRSPSDRHAQ
jgi:hypothetical protein